MAPAIRRHLFPRALRPEWPNPGCGRLPTEDRVAEAGGAVPARDPPDALAEPAADQREDRGPRGDHKAAGRAWCGGREPGYGDSPRGDGLSGFADLRAGAGRSRTGDA